MRRWLLLAGLVLLLGACSKGSKRDNIEPPAELLDFTPTVTVSQAWKHSLGKGERRLWTRQQAAVMDGKVFAADPSGLLQAFDADTGQSAWRVKSDLRFSSSPGVGEGSLVVGTLDGYVLAFNPDSGVERWRAPVSSEVIAAPLVSHGMAVVRSGDGRVYAFSITDGERRWVYDQATPALSLRGNSPPVWAEGLILIGSDSGKVVGLRADDGVEIWDLPVGFGEGRSELERMVDIDGEMVYEQGELFAAAFNAQIIDALIAEGRTLWNRDISSYAGLALSGEKLIVTDRDGTLWALDRSTGAALWKQDALSHRWLTTPVVHGHLIAVGDLDGYLHWFDLDTGEPAARVRLSKKPLRATPQVANGLLYAVSVDGQLGAFRY